MCRIGFPETKKPSFVSRQDPLFLVSPCHVHLPCVESGLDGENVSNLYQICMTLKMTHA